MPTYSLMVISDIEFDGGSARGNGGPRPNQGADRWGGAGHEVQIHTITSQKRLSQAFLCNAAIQKTRAAIIKASTDYQWLSRGLRWRIISCTLIGIIE